jgi:ATP-binding cassette subfamily F protein uup
MPHIILDQASLAFGHHPLLDQAHFQMDEGERIGLIGRNGTGKSSLLKILAKQHDLDSGNLWIAPELKVCYVPQEPHFDPNDQVFDAVAKGLGSLQKTLHDYHDISQQLSQNHAPKDIDILLERMQSLQHILDQEQAWSIQARVETAIDHLRLDGNQFIHQLSGGLRKRVALAQALVTSPDILLLDEPTNHLDVSSIEWLESLLVDFKGSVLFITHDRKFLDRVSTRIVELDRGTLYSFPGNFSSYQALKSRMLADETVAQAKFDKFLAQEEVWIRQGIKARRTRNEGRVRRLEALRKERVARRNTMGTVDLQLDAGERSGKLVAELERVTHSFDGRIIVRDLSCRIQRGDKIGLLGPNGIGKSTLLKIILGELSPDHGKVTQGTKLSVAYFDQLRTQLDEEATLVDVISQGSEFIEIGGQRKHVISYLQDFLFPPERARSPVKSCSGGERNRLLLARLFTQPANVLVLDEPTNDLDIETLELLEELLVDYDGTLFLVSHDRAFLDRVVTQVMVFEGQGKIQEYIGGYEDWQRAKAFQEKKQIQPSRPEESKNKPANTIQVETFPSKHSPKKNKLSFKERKELEELPSRIEQLEQEHKAILEKLSDPQLYRENLSYAKDLEQKSGAIDNELSAAMLRWEQLESQQ